MLYTINSDGTELTAFAAPLDRVTGVERPRQLPDGRVVFITKTDLRPGGSAEFVRLARPFSGREPLLADASAHVCSVQPMNGGSLLLCAAPSTAASSCWAPFRIEAGANTLGQAIPTQPGWNTLEAVQAARSERPMGRLSTMDPTRNTGQILCLNANDTRYTVGQPAAAPSSRIRVLTETGGMERLLGEVPLHPDGSFLVEVPADVPLGFEAVDEKGCVLRRVRPMVWVRPGENRSCHGCHAPPHHSPENHRPLAVTAPMTTSRNGTSWHGEKIGRRMRVRPLGIGISVGIVGCALGFLGHHFGGNAHVRHRLGQAPLTETSCFQCHFVSINRLLWAKPRPHHHSPAGLAVSPDGTRLYIALDDRDEVAEADVSSREVLRRVRVAGGPHGLAIDAAGKHLFVTCRHSDRLAQLDLPSLVESGSVAVGTGPTGVAYCQTDSGERVVVANSLSQNASVIALSPVRELSRPATGREPYAVAAVADGSRVFIVSRMVELARPDSVPASEMTILNPGNGRVVRREMLESAHLSEGVCVVPARSWSLTPIVKGTQPGSHHTGSRRVGHVQRLGGR